MLKKVLLFLVVLILFTSCTSDYDKKLKVSATTWIGYTPLFYAKEKGWLEHINVKLLNVSSLSENMYLYKAGNSDAYVGTQYEYNILSKADPSLKPIILFDKSNGGDIVMSNTSIKSLQTSEKIDAYLEMDSINFTMLKSFMKKYNIDTKKINYINKDQTQIAELKSIKNQTPTIIVTYVPYNHTLKKNGFTSIESTKNNLDLLIVDAMFTTTKKFHQHKKQFIELKKFVNEGVKALEKNPKEFYDTIKPYMLDVSYDEFKSSLDDIIWINENIPKELKQAINSSVFPTRDLL